MRPLDAALLTPTNAAPCAPQPPPTILTYKGQIPIPDPDPNPNQGDGALELDEIAPNYTVRMLMVDWIAKHRAATILQAAARALPCRRALREAREAAVAL